MLIFLLNIVKKIKYKRTAGTSHNRSVYASGAVAPSGSEKPQSGYALCAVFLRHFLARRNASLCFIGGPKRHIQPERYVQYPTNGFWKNIL
jgi:hypothetical protein